MYALPVQEYIQMLSSINFISSMIDSISVELHADRATVDEVACIDILIYSICV